VLEHHAEGDPARRQASTSATARAVVVSTGFSRRMCFPAAASVLPLMSRCALGGVRTRAASDRGIADDRRKIAGHREGEALGEGLAARPPSG